MIRASVPSGRKLWTLGLCLLGWMTLWIWSQSDFNTYLAHVDWTEAALLAATCSISGKSPMHFASMALAWLLMVVAMMLPVAGQFLAICLHARRRDDRAPQIAVWISLGYLIPWLVLGCLLHSVGYGIGTAAQNADWLISHGWLVGAAVMLGVALFQLSAIKIVLMRRMIQVERGTVQRIQNGVPGKHLVLCGARYGTLCAACCGPLMSLMFVFWSGSLIWNAFLGLLMLYERKKFQGLQMSRLIGSALLIATCALTIRLS